MTRSSAAIARRRCGTRFSTTSRAKATPSPRAPPRDVTARSRRARVQAILVDVYRTDPKNAELASGSSISTKASRSGAIVTSRWWNARSARRRGTGGSSGAEYLRGTLGRNLFPHLWEVRGSL